MSVTIEATSGEQIVPLIEDLARLRIAVFAEWPYLYDGDPAYEAAYLREFAAAPDAIMVTARDGERIVGAATASPMSAQKSELRAPFESCGFDTAKLFYFGESVLLPEYRGQGIGNAFFDYREEQAVRCGASHTCFAAVIRPPDHVDRPDDYRPLDAFWRKRGYLPISGLVTHLSWKDHGDDGETQKPMQYWSRRF
ncbi:N-acetyltransferase [Croceicoccus ponticola]|uniref:N-acetyltransferase n=1 Tax=Croceicoccus ponticola TaxID=2217664 RepID=A0A437H183_9SPHN|nr:GNAT family N-acetyltransferase [Croceicoccus ponticola]RVQ69293.1 N-acetyltransferase [Croceicoccus ponticola]